MSRRREPRGGGDELRVNAYSEKWLKKGFAWVYPKEVTAGRPGAPGAEVVVRGPSGALLGRGFSDEGFLAARVVRHGDGPLDEAFLAERLAAAVRLRRQVVPPETTAYRLVHGENDGLPGLRLDWWDGWITAVLDSPGVAPLLDRLLPALRAQLAPKGVYRCYRPDPRDARDAAAFSPGPGWLPGGSTDEEIEVVERGVRARVRPWEGPDVGLYCDMRDVRRWLEPMWRGRRVLNTFAYTGMFSVAAVVHGAAEVVTVDLSRQALDRARANLLLNGWVDDDDALICSDTFKALDRLRRTGARFDLVVVDPPSFSHGPAGTWSIKDYARLTAAAARVLEPGGWLLAATNHGQTSPKAFRGMVAEGLERAGRQGVELAWLPAAPDFPSAISFPEAHYLKVGLWSVA